MDKGRYTSVTLKNWDEIFDYVRKYEGSWIFRGHPSDFTFQTSLERACNRANVPLSKARQVEDRLVREFKRRFHLYAAHVPDDDDILEWLAIMQHHGAPTRLLDWTYSPFAAAYFALESTETDCVLWALDTDWLKEEIRSNRNLINPWKEFVNVRSGDSFRNLFWRDTPEKFVYGASPIGANERLAIQQGLFLCPGDVRYTFETNLGAFSTRRSSLIKITIPIGCRTRALRDLHRMNMNAATLFPGLDGFARSMWTRLEHLSAIPIKV